MASERKIVLCNPMFRPYIKRVTIPPRLGKVKYPYLHHRSGSCGGKSRITVLMHLLLLPPGRTAGEFSDYDEMMKASTQQSLHNPEVFAMLAQGTCQPVYCWKYLR